MLTRIIGLEWRLMRADRTAVAVCVLFGVVLATAAASGLGWGRAQGGAATAIIDQQQSKYRDARAHVARTPVLGPPEWGPASATWLGSFVGRYVVQPPTALRVLAIGQSDLYTPYSKVTARTREAVLAGDQSGNPLLLKVGQFDIAFVLIYLYPLFVLALAYDLTSGEREDGTLRLVAAQPVPLRHIVLGKVLARGAVVLLPALLAPAISLAIADPALSADDWTRFAVWTGAVGAYGLLWFAFAVVVNAWARPPAWNALLLSGAWLALVVVVPAAINILVSVAYPIPSRVEFINAARAATDRARVDGSRLLGRFIEEHPEFAVAGDAMKNASLLQAAGDDEIARQVAPVVGRFEAQMARQHAAATALRPLSPAALLQGVLVDAAGTGLDRHRHFAAQADAYHRQWRAYFRPLLFANLALTPATYDGLPAFTYREEPAAQVLGRTAAPLLGLIEVGGLALFFGLCAFNRYRVAGD